MLSRAPVLVTLSLVLGAAAPARAGGGPLIMLDPGHGGTNRGAHGPEIHAHEKQLTLVTTRRLARYLRHLVPGARVQLTRTRDTYLTLARRVELANEARATLFVSMHFNASESRAMKGYEVFILSREASENEAGRLAMRRAVATPTVIDGIVSDLQQSAAHGRSAQLARRIHRRLRAVRGAAIDRGVRQAPIDVLMGLTMPGVLGSTPGEPVHEVRVHFRGEEIPNLQAHPQQPVEPNENAGEQP